MKRILIIAALAILTGAAHAGDCTGKVKWYVEKTNEGLLGKGERLLEFGECGYTADMNAARQILKTCPIGSHCTVEGTSENIEEVGLEKLTKVKRVK